MHVLIIGAGLAGLTCARELVKRGISVQIVEASDGVGGRVRSDVVDGFTIDRGFQVLFDAYPAVRRQLDLAALDLRPFAPGAVICHNGRRALLTDPLRDPADALPAVLSDIIPFADKLRTLQLAIELRTRSIAQILAGEDTTTEAYLRGRGFAEQTIDRFFRPFYGGIFLDRSLATSAKCFRFDFKMLSDGGTMLPARGIGQISAQLAAPLLARGGVRLNAQVVALLRDADRVTGVRLASGEALHADAVVLATAAPEAAQLSGLPTPTGSVGTTAVYLAGHTPVWRGTKLALNAAAGALVNNAAMLSNVAAELAPAGRTLLSATILGAPAGDDMQIGRAALRELHQMFAGDRAAQAALASYQVLRVVRVPYAQFQQPPGIHPRLPDNRTTIGGLYVAAEWTEASSINAAILSGERCAAAIKAAEMRQ